MSCPDDGRIRRRTTVGNLIAGDAAFQQYLEQTARPRADIPLRARARRYVELARNVLQGAPPGSSAAGEQPKFLATVASHGEVLVKFSPPRNEPSGRRVADLLVAEHLAHEVLRRSGFEACRSSVLEAGGQRFLEIKRFDRTPRGRRGVIALEALDAEFSGQAERGQWARSVADIARAGRVDPSLVERVRWLQVFGALIVNTDMHAGNLSFITCGARVLALAPVYDMLPSGYALQQGHLTQPHPFSPAPTPSDAPVWDGACAAAEAFWDELARHSLVSKSFRLIARANRDAVRRSRALGARLPR